MAKPGSLRIFQPRCQLLWSTELDESVLNRVSTTLPPRVTLELEVDGPFDQWRDLLDQLIECNTTIIAILPAGTQESAYPIFAIEKLTLAIALHRLRLMVNSQALSYTPSTRLSWFNVKWKPVGLVLPKNLIRGKRASHPGWRTKVQYTRNEHHVKENAPRELLQTHLCAKRCQEHSRRSLPDFLYAAPRMYLWCKPPRYGIATTSPSDAGSTRRGVGELRSRDK